MENSGLKLSTTRLASPTNSSAEERHSEQARHRIKRLVLGLAAMTFALMVVGGLTRVMGAGLSCPDWPLCYGALVPHMDQYIFLEWFHRVIATGVGLGTVVLCALCWWSRRELPQWLVGLAGVALVLVLVQGALGALTVTEYLRFDIVTAHLGTAMLFFATLLVMAAALTASPAALGPVGMLPWVALAATLICYTQIVLGGLVASQWAVHQCLEGSLLCDVMNNHLIGVGPTVAAVLLVVWTAWRRGLSGILKRISWLTGGFLVIQVALGVATFVLKLSVPLVTVAHLAVGAALLGTLVVLTVLSWRDRQFDRAAHLQQGN
ncbi:MAG: COX15/CtaA family protein [Gemmatimonadaceae bacterium]|nr:COX15/CtaA family protein [Gloeobacterales cyanobacterium ES-bin-141]